MFNNNWIIDFIMIQNLIYIRDILIMVISYTLKIKIGFIYIKKKKKYIKFIKYVNSV